MVTTRERIVIIGNGMVSHYFIEQAIQSELNASILVLSGESRLAYDRVHLSSFFDGTSEGALSLTTTEYYDEHGIDYRLSAWVKNIDKANKVVITESGDVFEYDVLIFATGSYPFVPSIPGNDQPHCLTYRTIDDLHEIKSSAEKSEKGVVLGGGLLGLEAANALKQADLETHVVEFAPRLMSVQVDEMGGDILRKKIEELGVGVHTGKATTEIIEGKSSRYRMNFSDGTHLETDMIVFSAGIRPHDELADQIDLSIGARGGISINHYCETSEPDIYAIGECAAWDDQIFGLVAPGYAMARTVANRLVGQKQPFEGADMSTKLKLLGVDVASIGDAHGKTDGAKSYVYANSVTDVYKKLVVDESHQRVIGAVLVGDASEYDTLLQYHLNQIPLGDAPESLILPSASDAPTMGNDILPDSSTICSCHNVSKGDIINAIGSGACNIADVKSCTKAGTGCGGCSALLKSVVDSELEKSGIEVSKAICEHFEYSRQELFHLVKVNDIRSFDELLDRYGKGLGCDICKPTVGSILASIWNEYVLKTEHLPLQDTNDIYLGNMQKDGSYSVVPRIAGGEITPEQLIAIGSIAKTYNLYTKITGGQRIDLFGARVDQLPEIWKQLLDNGFETGHAYAKAVRTVKSCVGSTWCRYGVQDSVGQAIHLENRYKGLRAPHKLKFAVSGCTRECAEAQSKDIGVIATENGWNLYVCGNGGMKPRHADLFATDLDDQTLVAYIDRILMFYIRTAGRLQRTSVWMDNLEGGLDYLREVIINDCLGINHELEAQMEQVIGAYECEWKKTIESPEKMLRFKQFINADDIDTHIQFTEERGQIKPVSEIERMQLIDIKTV